MSLSKLSPVGTKLKAVFETEDTAYELLESIVDRIIREKLGDSPQWLKITAYREAGHRAEVLINLRGRDYWFPVSRSVYENFISKAMTTSRGAGLVYLKNYIREHRKYRERWPDAVYTRRTKLKKGSFLDETSMSQLGISEDVVKKICKLSERGHSPREISKILKVSYPQVESALNMNNMFSPRALYDPSAGDIQGVLSVDEEMSKLTGQDSQAARTIQRLKSGPPDRMKPIRSKYSKAKQMAKTPVLGLIK